LNHRSKTTATECLDRRNATASRVGRPSNSTPSLIDAKKRIATSENRFAGPANQCYKVIIAELDLNPPGARRGGFLFCPFGTSTSSVRLEDDTNQKEWR
jgi:hypothetical protein